MFLFFAKYKQCCYELFNTVYIYGCTCACIYIGCVSRNWSCHWFCIFLTLVGDGIVSQRDCTSFTLSPAVNESSYCSMSLWIPGIINRFNIIILVSHPTYDPNAFFWWQMRLSWVYGSFGYLICESLFKSFVHFSVVLSFLFLIHTDL